MDPDWSPCYKEGRLYLAPLILLNGYADPAQVLWALRNVTSHCDFA